MGFARANWSEEFHTHFFVIVKWFSRKKDLSRDFSVLAHQESVLPSVTILSRIQQVLSVTPGDILPDLSPAFPTCHLSFVQEGNNLTLGGDDLPYFGYIVWLKQYIAKICLAWFVSEPNSIILWLCWAWSSCRLNYTLPFNLPICLRIAYGACHLDYCC